jgi:FMN phosphatase YigB (HAD superfamily)
MSPLLENFYSGDFQSIKNVTHTRPDAIQFIQKCFGQGFTIAIATNPLFPVKAMLSRLNWADLPLEKYPFSLITGYESFHFAKPNPTYYAEILAQLGAPEGPVAMIGNSISDDINPASSLGIKTFFLTDKPSEILSSAQGNFSDCANWLAELSKENNNSFELSSRESILAFLIGYATALETTLNLINPSLLNIRPQKDEWSIQEIICI